jgi:hypothetical protein
MQLLRAITEDELVAVFLKTEIASARFEPEIRRLLERDGCDPEVVKNPDWNDQAENRYRKRLLGDFRGYQRNGGLFIGYPDHVEWHRAMLTREEITQIRYIDYSYWNELSQHSRLPLVAAESIRRGQVIYGESTHGFLVLAQELCQGACFPELIVTAASLSSPVVVMEGHARLTAYGLAPHCLPDELEVLIGFSPDFPEWGAHGTP